LAGSALDADKTRPAGGVHSDRAAMLARLVSHDQSDLALTFAGEDRALQIHLL
jgi:microcystin degradation protein MlrC